MITFINCFGWMVKLLKEPLNKCAKKFFISKKKMEKCAKMKYCRADDCAEQILESDKYCANCVLLLFSSLNQYEQDDIYFTLILSDKTSN
jgi:hypothetical protein